MFTPENVVVYSFWISIANFVVLVTLGIWGVRKVYIESQLASKRHRAEVALSKDLELLNRALHLLSEIYHSTNTFYSLLEGKVPSGEIQKLSSLSAVEIVKLTQTNLISTSEIRGIARVIGDSELSEKIDKWGRQNVKRLNLIQSGNSSHDDTIEHQKASSELITDVFARIYELMKLKTVDTIL